MREATADDHRDPLRPKSTSRRRSWLARNQREIRAHLGGKAGAYIFDGRPSRNDSRRSIAVVRVRAVDSEQARVMHADQPFGRGRCDGHSVPAEASSIADDTRLPRAGHYDRLLRTNAAPRARGATDADYAEVGR